MLADTGLAYYAGCDEEILPLRAIGAAGCVSTVAGVAGGLVREMLDAFDAGDLDGARKRHHALAPLVGALQSAPGTVTLKAIHRAAGLPGGPVRGPLLPADETLTAELVAAFRQANA